MANGGRSALRRVHIWLGWIVGIPLLIWTGSGLFMASRPIDQVRGRHLVGEAPALALSAAPAVPAIGPRPVQSLKLEQRSDGPRWVITYADGGARLAEVTTGQFLPPLTPADAAREVRARYKGMAEITAVTRTSAEAPPIDLRRPVATWRVKMDDGTRIYVHADTGEILATRTKLWRVYDFMWGLHILDIKTREDLNSPWLIASAAVSFLAVLLALILLPLSIRRRRGK